VTPASSITSDHRLSLPCLINDHHHQHPSIPPIAKKVQISASIVTLNSEDDGDDACPSGISSLLTFGLICCDLESRRG
jgi:hypothetical protein